MAVHVGELTSEVVPAPEAGDMAPAQGSGAGSWEELERVEELVSRLRSEEARTRAEGFDD
jgi:hypothetical protein